LQHAHEQGLVHRDIKPGNLLVTGGSSPVVKILDMGLARLGGSFDNERQLTKMGQVLGTPDYLAPEQAIDARSVDIRADIYSLGCTLFFLLTGRTPFRGETLAELLLKHQLEPAPPLRAALPDAPPELEALLDRMMAKKPDDRPATPALVAAALEPLARGEGGAAPVALPPPPSVSADAWATLNEDGEELIARPPVRGGDRFHDTIPQRSLEGRARRKRKRKNNAPLLIGVGILVGALVVGAAVTTAVLLLSRPAKKPADQTAQTKQSPRDKAGELPPPPKDEKGPLFLPEEKQPPPRPVGDGSIYDLAEAAAQGEKWTKTELLGGGSKEFYDIPKPGALLIGFEVGVGRWNKQEVIHSLRALFQFRDKLRRNVQRRSVLWGKEQEKVVTLKAKPGYAVGKVTLRAGLGIDAIKVTFMAIDGQKLNPIDSYDSDWIGGKGGNERSIGGDGTPVIGIYGRAHERDGVTNGLGLILPAVAR
jgi:hypothetical protein